MQQSVSRDLFSKFIRRATQPAARAHRPSDVIVSPPGFTLKTAPANLEEVIGGPLRSLDLVL
jgi:hypothetical protein